MKRSGSLVLMGLILAVAIAMVPGCKSKAKKLVGTWSYEKTESNMLGKGITLKVFNEWLITFNDDGTYAESSKMQPNAKPIEVKGTYNVEGDIVRRSANPIKMQILTLTGKELVITSIPNTKIFFKKK